MLNKILIMLIISILMLAACESDPITAPGENDPIYISNPSGGQTIGEPLFISANSGTGEVFESVDFYIDGDSVWSDNSSPYQYYWNIFQYSPMTTHEIYAIGQTADSVFTSITVNVTVSFETGILFLSAYQPNSQQAFGVSAYMDYMFVATGPAGLELVDISDKTFPAYLSRFDSPGQAKKVEHSFPYVYLADLDGGVARAVVTTSDTLELRGTYDTPGSSSDVAVNGDYLYVADHENLAIVDISDPDALVPVSVFTMSAGVNYVIARNDTAFVTNNTGFYIIDCTDPEMPVEVGYIVTQGNAQAVAVQDTFAFVADGADGVKVFSINDPENITPLSSYIIGQSNVSTVDVRDNTLFAGTLSGDLLAFDFRTPGGMTVLDTYIFDTGMIHHVYYDAPYLFVALSDKVGIFRFLR